MERIINTMGMDPEDILSNASKQPFSTTQTKHEGQGSCIKLFMQRIWTLEESPKSGLHHIID